MAHHMEKHEKKHEMPKHMAHHGGHKGMAHKDGKGFVAGPATHLKAMTKKGK